MGNNNNNKWGMSGCLDKISYANVNFREGSAGMVYVNFLHFEDLLV